MVTTLDPKVPQERIYGRQSCLPVNEGMYPVIAPMSATDPEDNSGRFSLGCRETRPEMAVHPAFGVRFPAEVALTIGHIFPFFVGTNMSVASHSRIIFSGITSGTDWRINSGQITFTTIGIRFSPPGVYHHVSPVDCIQEMTTHEQL
jgi:hypothetical protein